jgi:hypothetical protein
MFRLAVAASASLIAIAVAMPASASTISVTNIQFSNGSRPIVVDKGSSVDLVSAGRFRLEATSVDDLFLWCVDIFNELVRGNYDPPLVYTTGTLQDDNDPNGPNPLSAAQKSRVAGLALAGDAALAANPTRPDIVSAAYQAAIWQTIYPTITFRAENAGGRLQSLIDTLNNDTGFSGGPGTLYTPTNGQGEVISQKLFTGNGPDPIDPIPAPAAIGLFGFALAGLLLARRATA